MLRVIITVERNHGAFTHQEMQRRFIDLLVQEHILGNSENFLMYDMMHYSHGNFFYFTYLNQIFY